MKTLISTNIFTNISTYISTNGLPKILLALALLLFAGWSPIASAEEMMPETDPTAPCGELHLIGKQSIIFNQSNFTFNVIFKTNANRTWRDSINAGAVKYLEWDANGSGVWRDTGIGDYRSSKTYTIPVKSKSAVAIAYCAASARDLALITGVVFFTADASEAPHHIPVGNISFEGRDGYIHDTRLPVYDVRKVHFDHGGHESYVDYNASPYGVDLDGSITICPHDASCSVP